MMFSHSGIMLKKKKTTVRLDTRDPVFNETLNFEVSLLFDVFPRTSTSFLFDVF